MVTSTVVAVVATVAVTTTEQTEAMVAVVREPGLTTVATVCMAPN